METSCSKKLASNQFQPLVKAIHEYYTPIINQYCIPALINVYRYEFTVIEENLVEFVHQTFHKLIYSPNAIVKDKIKEEFKEKSEWKSLAIIQEKLALLETIS